MCALFYWASTICSYCFCQLIITLVLFQNQKNWLHRKANICLPFITHQSHWINWNDYSNSAITIRFTSWWYHWNQVFYNSLYLILILTRKKYFTHIYVCVCNASPKIMRKATENISIYFVSFFLEKTQL